VPPKKVTCPSCGAEVILGKFCLECGAELITESQAKLADDVVEQIAERAKQKIIEELDRRAKPKPPETIPTPGPAPENTVPAGGPTVPAPKAAGAGRFFKP
jgi:hypothetical protein